jgi:septum formation protein
MKPIVLASTSPYRRALLERLKIPFSAVAPHVDEDAAKREIAEPEALVRHLAREKARSLAARFPAALVIGSDQAVDIDGQALGKPKTAEAAVNQLIWLSGREHKIHTAVAVHDAASGRTEEALDTHRIRLRVLTVDEIRSYVARERPLDCAGSYRIEALGIALMERISGDDYTAVIGLPLMRLVDLLARFGVRALA